MHFLIIYRSLVHFTDARLVSLTNTVYLELGKPEIDGDFACSFCNKLGAHEHEFTGRVKFEAKEKRYFISFIKTQLVDKKSAPGKRRDGHSVTQDSANAGAQVIHRLAESEEGAIKVARNALEAFEEDASRTQIKVAVKAMNTNRILSIEGSITREDRSVLKNSRNRASNLKNCPECPNMLEGSDIEPLISHAASAHSLILTYKWTPEIVAHTCDLCQARFLTESNLIKHCNELHAITGDLPYQCEACFQKFNSIRNLKRHTTLTHEQVRERQFVCHLCNKGFLKIQHLQEHFRTHMGVRPHQCNICDKKYSTAALLKNHKMNAHGEGDRPSCSQCHKTFHNVTYLNKHMLKSHKKDLRFSCPHCGQYYLRRTNLDQHLQNAHGERLKCNQCNTRFASQMNLEAHLRDTHGIVAWNTLSKNKPNLTEEEKNENATSSQIKCRVCERDILSTEMENHLRYSHGIIPGRSDGKGSNCDSAVTEAAEALLRTLTPQPDYLLRCLTPLPMETLDDL